MVFTTTVTTHHIHLLKNFLQSYILPTLSLEESRNQTANPPLSHIFIDGLVLLFCGLTPVFLLTAPQQQVIVQDPKILQHMSATGMVSKRVRDAGNYTKGGKTKSLQIQLNASTGSCVQNLTVTKNYKDFNIIVWNNNSTTIKQMTKDRI